MSTEECSRLLVLVTLANRFLHRRRRTWCSLKYRGRKSPKVAVLFYAIFIAIFLKVIYQDRKYCKTLIAYHLYFGYLEQSSTYVSSKFNFNLMESRGLLRFEKMLLNFKFLSYSPYFDVWPT